MWIQTVKHKQFYEESFSRQFYLHCVASCFAASSVSRMYSPFLWQKEEEFGHALLYLPNLSPNYS